MPHKSSKKRCQYDPKNIELAVSAVNCKNMSIRQAASHFCVPRSTLHDRLSGRIGPSPSHGKQTVFPEHVERKLADKIHEAATMGFGIDRKQLQVKAANLNKQFKIKTPFKNGIPGKDWISGFIKRHNISLRSQVPLSTVRGRMLNLTVTDKYFKDLNVVIETLNLENSPSKIWNMDETSLSLTHKPTKVYAKKTSRNIPGRVGNSRESITITACVNAAGEAMPPMMIVKGKTKKALNAYNLAEGPANTKYTYQEKGWMENSLGKEWFENVFLEHCGQDRPQLLLLDSHSSHETLGILESAKANGITMFALPPHTTQWLNPLDKTLFGPLSREYNKQCTLFMVDSPNNMVCKWEFPRLFKVAYEVTFNKHNISKGFEACGIFPFNPHAIPKAAFNPSMPFESASTSAKKIENTAATTGPQSIQHNDMIQNTTNEEIGNTTEQNGHDQQVSLIGEADDAGIMNIESATAAEVLQAILDSSIDVNLEIDQAFQLPPADRSTENKTTTTKRKLTSHRILTSDEVLEEKRQAKRVKEEQLKIKEERKKERLLKREAKNAKKKIYSPPCQVKM